MTKLSVNVNKIALLRNSRDGDVPSVVGFARRALAAGAHGVTVHPRPDERHIRPSDVRALRAMLDGGDFEGVEYNIEGNPFEEPYMDLIREVKPDQATLVPDAPGQKTSDHGWDVGAHGARLGRIISELKALGCRVSLFMDANPEAISEVASTGADRVELYTESYAIAFRAGGEALAASLSRFGTAAARARELGLGVNAGHDLNQENLGAFLEIPGILEVSIGHALVAECLEAGVQETVRAYVDIVGAAAPAS